MEYTFWNIFLVAIISYIIYLVGYLRGWRKYEQVMLEESIKAEKALQSVLQKKNEPNCYILKIEGVYYLFMLKDNKFVTQANSWEELQNWLNVNRPNEWFYISKENLTKIGHNKVDTYE
jgi:hypothetical protein